MQVLANPWAAVLPVVWFSSQEEVQSGTIQHHTTFVVLQPTLENHQTSARELAQEMQRNIARPSEQITYISRISISYN